MIKRVVDVVICSITLVLIMPLLLVIALMVLVTDGMPVLFRQTRVGKDGVDFNLVKFRTMSHRPPSQFGDFDAGDVSRVTRIGKFLRHWKLDELPQLWNVLRGDMSLVGPRPEVRKWVNVYPAEWAEVLKVRPGITDPASIVYRHEESLLAASDEPERFYADTVLPSKLTIYKEYVSSGNNIAKDAAILLRTIAAVAAPRKESA
ncbi:UDP-N-acetylgalactosamine-undecaprenyl-phosphate N-acetylgalactosaminephosphotransferase [Rosistilla oblonga]|uniref:sugar transferase n=1 Tax=Rosistilla oblonga TaxID=2527990 RepID=UPI00118A1D13|nr:sugar transferase [Rosistilla oblonga]QDV11306.1 UDP-N-acetylgalactosamine-undecaprenyl-phosphate N-acetylgalactosaminephosphotransferase [Rosistilla oblonga]